MKFCSTPLPGVMSIELKVFEDARGFFAETYHQDLFTRHGISQAFVQDNCSSSARGTLRGMHYQLAPAEQAKLVRVVVGEIFDVVIDIRPSSPTYGRWHGETLSAANRKMLFAPAGFAHGFLVMSDRAEVLYKTTAYYAPSLERGIPWNDPSIGISWPDPGCGYILSDRDRSHPPFRVSAR